MKKKTFYQYATILVVCILVGTVIALLMKNVNASDSESKSLQELQNQIIEYQRKNEELNNRNARLYDYITELERGEGESYLLVMEEREKFATFAGLRAVKNDGVIITISPIGNYQVQDALVRQFTNELSALGAQAISINNERKVTTTEIRTSRENIMINGIAFSRSEPFEIKAIINPTKIDSFVVPYLQSVSESIKKQLGEESVAITVRREKGMIIPALSEDRIGYAMDLLIPAD
ncbi:MAG TPA: DUF881 domain-containing protein [Clostridiaceae bacterium]|nr:DUF881 domain-containing protein [Clostridiaceae bacterium]